MGSPAKSYDLPVVAVEPRCDTLAILMAYPEAFICSCSIDGLQLIDYYDTEHYRVMHDFIVAPKRMLDVLFEPPRDLRRLGCVSQAAMA